jgi:hypothetical protein
VFSVKEEFNLIGNVDLFSFTRGRAVAHEISRLPLAVEARVRSQFSSCEICGGQSGTETGFSPSTSIFPCQYHSKSVPYSSSSTCYCFQKNKRAKPGNKQCSFGNRRVEQKITFTFSPLRRVKLTHKSTTVS